MQMWVLSNLRQSQCSEVQLGPSGYSEAAQAHASAKGQVCIWAFVPQCHLQPPPGAFRTQACNVQVLLAYQLLFG